MFKIRKEEDREERVVNMMPLIDLVFLLLVYFMLTMTFVDEEKWMQQMMDTTQGSAVNDVEIEPPQDINICIYPEGAEGIDSTEALQKWFKSWTEKPKVVIRIKSAKMILDQSQDKEEQLTQIHEFIQTELMRYELNMVTREGQDPIKVNCFSHLPWYYASAAYDAVRAHESSFNGGPYTIGRDFKFAPREVNRMSYDQAGRELHRLTKLR